MRDRQQSMDQVERLYAGQRRRRRILLAALVGA